jgi:hypothetical protein
MIKCTRCPKQKESTLPKANLSYTPTYFFTINTPDVRVLIEPVIICA